MFLISNLGSMFSRHGKQTKWKHQHSLQMSWTLETHIYVFVEVPPNGREDDRELLQSSILYCWTY